MIPDIDTQLLSVIKSLKDTVAPAVAKDNQLAQEQLHLALATLSIVRQHLPLYHRYVRLDTEIQINLAHDLLLNKGNSDQCNLIKTLESTQQLLTDPTQSSDDLLAGNRTLREVIAQYLLDNIDNVANDNIVLKHSKKGLDMGRAWNKPMGFEPDPDSVTELEQLLAK